MKFKINKDYFYKVKEINLYLFGLSFFANFTLAKIFLAIMPIFMLVDNFYFKKKMNCGNMKTTNFIMFLVFGGLLWNYLPHFNGQAAKAYFELNKYFVIVFYLSFLVENDKRILKNFIITLIIGYVYLFFKGLWIYIKEGTLISYEMDSKDAISIAISTPIVGAFSFGQFLERDDKKTMVISSVIFISCFILMVFTKSLESLFAMLGAIGVMLFFSRSFKVIGSGIAVIILGMFFIFRTPNVTKVEKINATVTSLVEERVKNGSDDIINKVKKYFILEKKSRVAYKELVDYVKKMPDDKKSENIDEKKFETRYSFAHSMYLNAVTDSGVFVVVQLFFLFGVIPYILIKNKNYRYRISLLGCFLSYYIFGMVWALFKHGWDPMLFWTLVAFACANYRFMPEEKN